MSEILPSSSTTDNEDEGYLLQLQDSMCSNYDTGNE